MNITRGIARFALFILIWGAWATSCTTVTDPTRPSTDVTSSTSPGSSSKAKAEQQATMFASNNFSRIKEDMALGQGEHLASLATLLGVPEERQAEFFALAKEKFPTLVDSERTTSEELLAALDRELAMHPYLRKVATTN